MDTMHLVQNQSSRKITWIYDTTGNRGKTFFANILCYVYGFQFIDATLQLKDAALLFNRKSKGICFDIPRDTTDISYVTMESFKNGLLISG